MITYNSVQQRKFANYIQRLNGGVGGGEKTYIYLNIQKKIQIKKKKKSQMEQYTFLKRGGDYMCENVKMKQKAGYQRHVFSF